MGSHSSHPYPVLSLNQAGEAQPQLLCRAGPQGGTALCHRPHPTRPFRAANPAFTSTRRGLWLGFRGHGPHCI